MRFIKILSVFALLILSKFAIAQPINLETVIYSYAPQQNGTILLNYNLPTTMRASFTVSRPITGNWPNLPIKAQISLYVLSPLVSNSLIDVIDVSTSDWYGPSYQISKVIEKDIVIPAGAVTLTNPNTSILARWRFYKEGYPSPYNTDGWTDWVDAKYTSMALNQGQIPQSTFTGPNAICDEGIYTITNPYTVSLENATGIATLTSLGNNQWKVTRIGNAVGKVYLRSTFSDQVYSKGIMVNSEMQGTFSGAGSIKQGLSGTVTFTPDAGTNYTNLSWTVDAGAHTSLQIDPYNLKITIPANYPLYDTYNGDDVYVTVKGYGECGLMEKTHVLKILPRQPSNPPQQ